MDWIKGAVSSLLTGEYEGQALQRTGIIERDILMRYFSECMTSMNDPKFAKVLTDAQSMGRNAQVPQCPSLIMTLNFWYGLVQELCCEFV